MTQHVFDQTMSDRIAVVTGGTAGIGYEMVKTLIGHSCPVVANGRRPDRLKDLILEFNEENVRTVRGDAADEKVVTQMFDTARDVFGDETSEADIVIVNAGRGLKGSVLDSDSAQWEEMIRTNLLGAALTIRHAARRMMANIERLHSRGKSWQTHAHDIVVIGSTVGRNVSPFSSMYGSTKFGVHGLVEGARRELGPKGIRVTLIEPGFVESEFQGVAGYDPAWFKGVVERIGPVLQPEDVARAIMAVITQPPWVHFNDVALRPTRQDYP
ncbi:MAG TPA: SDR family oxidoreductase [Phycisphaerales bacterium]|nr:SDR family oxidoreductase [Phycisphaerales bacterium]